MGQGNRTPLLPTPALSPLWIVLRSRDSMVVLDEFVDGVRNVYLTGGSGYLGGEVMRVIATTGIRCV